MTVLGTPHVTAGPDNCQITLDPEQGGCTFWMGVKQFIEGWRHHDGDHHWIMGPVTVPWVNNGCMTALVHLQRIGMSNC